MNSSQLTQPHSWHKPNSHYSYPSTYIFFIPEACLLIRAGHGRPVRQFVLVRLLAKQVFGASRPHLLQRTLKPEAVPRGDGARKPGW